MLSPCGTRASGSSCSVRLISAPAHRSSLQSQRRWAASGLLSGLQAFPSSCSMSTGLGPVLDVVPCCQVSGPGPRPEELHDELPGD